MKPNLYEVLVSRGQKHDQDWHEFASVTAYSLEEAREAVMRSWPKIHQDYKGVLIAPIGGSCVNDEEYYRMEFAV